MTLGVVRALAGREFLRFIRQPHRVLGSIGQPLMFWVFLGGGLTPAFDAPGLGDVTYLEYFYPGVLVMMLLFASIFSSITLIEDRDAGFLQGVMVAPVPRLAMVLGKVTGGGVIALVQALILLLAAPLVGLMPGPTGILMVLAALVLSALGFTSLGFLVAWGMKSTSGFHAIMMVFLFPLWMLSGALFPLTTAPGWMYGIMLVNPVSHALTLIRGPFENAPADLIAAPDYWIALAVVLAWVGLCLALGTRRVSRVERGV